MAAKKKSARTRTSTATKTRSGPARKKAAKAANATSPSSRNKAPRAPEASAPLPPPRPGVPSPGAPTSPPMPGAPGPGAPPGRPLSKRKAKAAETRRRMVTAASALFAERGFMGTTIEAIAKEAGVAVQTVYFTFNHKTAILLEAFDAAVLGPAPMPPPLTAWYQAMVATSDPELAVRLLVENVAEISQRVWPLMAVIHTVAGEPEVAAFASERERWRAHGYREMAEILERKRRFRAGVDLNRATDIMLVLESPRTYRALTDERGWSHRDYVEWVSEALYRELWDEPGRRSRK